MFVLFVAQLFDRDEEQDFDLATKSTKTPKNFSWESYAFCSPTV
jgi:hypothetical protein